MQPNVAVGRIGAVGAVAGSVLLVAGACSDEVSKMMMDAGQALMDAGAAMDDAAAAQGGSGFKNGSRIQMRSVLMAGTDGSQTASSPMPFDTMLGVSCSVQRASDGKLRCLPSLPQLGGVAYFADAGCTQRLALQSCTDQAPAYWLDLIGGLSCTAETVVGAYRVFRVGAEHTGAVYSRVTSCAPATRPAERTYLVGVEVAPSSFVEFTSAGTASL